MLYVHRRRIALLAHKAARGQATATARWPSSFWGDAARLKFRTQLVGSSKVACALGGHPFVELAFGRTIVAALPRLLATAARVRGATALLAVETIRIAITPPFVIAAPLAIVAPLPLALWHGAGTLPLDAYHIAAHRRPPEAQRVAHPRLVGERHAPKPEWGAVSLVGCHVHIGDVAALEKPVRRPMPAGSSIGERMGMEGRQQPPQAAAGHSAPDLWPSVG